MCFGKLTSVLIHSTRNLSWELPLRLLGRVKVARKGVLLIVKKTSVGYTIIVNDLPSPYLLWVTLLNVLVLVLAIADVCHRRQNHEQVVKWSEDRSGVNISYHTGIKTFFSSDPPLRSSLISYQDNLPA
jgi:hypothetical protein